jgi:S1-C subfamily serine protease
MTDSIVKNGVEVVLVGPGSEAERVGVEKGDKILVVNGQPIYNLEEYYQARKQRQDMLEITVQRGQKVFDLTLVLTNADQLT